MIVNSPLIFKLSKPLSHWAYSSESLQKGVRAAVAQRTLATDGFQGMSHWTNPLPSKCAECSKLDRVEQERIRESVSGGRWKAVRSTTGQLTSVFSRGRSASFPSLFHMIHAALSQHYWWESQKIREGMKRKFVPCQVKTSARDNATPGKATEEEKYSSDGSHCWLQGSAEPFSKSSWVSWLAMSRRAQWSRRLLCWASLAQVSVRLTLASGKRMLFGLVMALRNRPLSSKKKLEEVLERKSGSFPLYYCHWMLSLKDYFSRRQ